MFTRAQYISHSFSKRLSFYVKKSTPNQMQRGHFIRDSWKMFSLRIHFFYIFVWLLMFHQQHWEEKWEKCFVFHWNNKIVVCI